MNSFVIASTKFFYRNVAKKIFFRRDPEVVHEGMTDMGERLGRWRAARGMFGAFFAGKDPALAQDLFGLSFKSPVGLAAGFDYEARLTQILPFVGFGWGTVGTLTHLPYKGNARPMLGRMPRSKSLMVNKGFKNLGVAQTLANLKGLSFAYPMGVSIGKTNTPDHTLQAHGVADVVAGFRDAEASVVPFAYYELNISCPNLVGNIEFYESEHLRELLAALAPLNISRPVFVKMPISKTDAEVRAMMDVIVEYPYLKAVIFGNLQTRRNDPALVPEEVARFPKGNFSGLPTRKRSDELIRLVYKEYGSKIRVIGCGGIFSAEDAYRKIRLGACLVQMITGMIYEGPQVVAEINRDLVRFLKRDGFASIADAVGMDA